MRLTEKRKPTTTIDKMRARRVQARRHSRGAAPSQSIPFTGRDMETGRAITRAWLSQLDGIIVLEDGVHLHREGVTVAVIQDPDLATALERGAAFGLTSHTTAA